MDYPMEQERVATISCALLLMMLAESYPSVSTHYKVLTTQYSQFFQPTISCTII